MIEIRIKKQEFHQSIRRNQRLSIKRKLRKSLIRQIDSEEVGSKLDYLFRYFHENQDDQNSFWKGQFVPQFGSYKTPHEFIDRICLNSKNIIAEYQDNELVKSQICQYLIENLNLLIPPQNIKLYELPKSFIELCLFLLKKQEFSQQQKLEFYQNFNQQTLNRCLLDYFAQNWAQIKQNQCSDLTMTFFSQIIKLRNIFKNTFYNSLKYEFILNLLVKQIMSCTESERRVYDDFQISINCLQDSWNTSEMVFHGTNFRDQFYLNSNNVAYLIKNCMFLCNLLLLSTQSNYTIKNLRRQLKSMLHYLYRSIFLNAQYENFKKSVQYCISVLVIFTADNISNDYLKIMTSLLNSDLQREKIKRQNESNKFVIQQDQNNDKNQLQSTVNQINVEDSQFQILFARVKLLMIYTLSQQTQSLRIQHVEKWIFYQFRKTEANIFTLENAQLIGKFLVLLKNIICLTQKHEHFKFYSYNNVCSHGQRKQEGFEAKIKIFNLLTKNGIKQIMNHKNFKDYSIFFGELVYFMIKGLEYINLRQNSSLLSCFMEVYDQTQLFDEKILHQDSINSLSLKSFKNQIYSLSLDLLRTRFKLLDYATKQKLILHLVLDNRIGFEDECNSFLTQEENKKMSKNLYKYEKNDEDQSDDSDELQFSDKMHYQDCEKQNQKSSIKSSSNKVQHYSYQRLQIQNDTKVHSINFNNNCSNSFSNWNSIISNKQNRERIQQVQYEI